MDHRDIEENRVPERYLAHALPPRERTEFEAHMVDCQECTDRLLLAEMFHIHNGRPQPPAPVQVIRPPEPELPLRARFAAQFSPWQLTLLFALTALLLVLIPVIYFVLEMRSLGSPR